MPVLQVPLGHDSCEHDPWTGEYEQHGQRLETSVERDSNRLLLELDRKQRHRLTRRLDRADTLRCQDSFGARQSLRERGAVDPPC